MLTQTCIAENIIRVVIVLIVSFLFFPDAGGCVALLVTPEARISNIYNDNLYLTAGRSKYADNVIGMSPGLELSLDLGYSKFFSLTRVDIDRYLFDEFAENKNDPKASLNPHLNDLGAISLENTLSLAGLLSGHTKYDFLNLTSYRPSQVMTTKADFERSKGGFLFSQTDRIPVVTIFTNIVQWSTTTQVSEYLGVATNLHHDYFDYTSEDGDLSGSGSSSQLSNYGYSDFQTIQFSPSISLKALQPGLFFGLAGEGSYHYSSIIDDGQASLHLTGEKRVEGSYILAGNVGLEKLFSKTEDSSRLGLIFGLRSELSIIPRRFVIKSRLGRSAKFVPVLNQLSYANAFEIAIETVAYRIDPRRFFAVDLSNIISLNDSGNGLKATIVQPTLSLGYKNEPAFAVLAVLYYQRQWSNSTIDSPFIQDFSNFMLTLLFAYRFETLRIPL